MKRIISAVMLILLALAVFAGCGKDDDMSKLSFHSFDGGGPSYSVTIADPGVVSYKMKTKYSSPLHFIQTGSGYDVTFSFKGLKQGETTVTIEQRSDLGDNRDYLYSVTVDEHRRVKLTKLSETYLSDAVTPIAVLVIEKDGRMLYADLEDNSSAEALRDILNSSPLQVPFLRNEAGSSFPGAVCELHSTIADSGGEYNLRAGDIVLLEYNKLGVCFSDCGLPLTRLARIQVSSPDELNEFFGDGDAAVTLYLEWSE